MKLEFFWTDFRKILKNKISCKSRLMGACGRTDGRTWRSK